MVAWGSGLKWGLILNGNQGSVGNAGRILRLDVGMVVHPYEFRQFHQPVYFKCIHPMVCKLYLKEGGGGGEKEKK